MYIFVVKYIVNCFSSGYSGLYFFLLSVLLWLWMSWIRPQMSWTRSDWKMPPKHLSSLKYQACQNPKRRQLIFSIIIFKFLFLCQHQHRQVYVPEVIAFFKFVARFTRLVVSTALLFFLNQEQCTYSCIFYL